MEKSYREVLSEGEQKLALAGILEAKSDAWYLLTDVFKISRVEYLLNQDQKVNNSLYDAYDKLIEERRKHIPLQYILGKQEFMGFEFKVNEHVLIPRQDTECLVEVMLAYVEHKKVLDVCTGSGCIIISLSKLKHLCKATGLDISNQAIEVAKENATLLDADVEFIISDLFRNVTEKYDIIVSNPPYIPTKVIEELMPEVKDYEPMLALDGMEDGLTFYRRIIKEATYFLEKDGMLFFEIGCEQGEDVKQLMEKQGFQEVRVEQDLAGLDRIVYGKYSE